MKQYRYKKIVEWEKDDFGFINNYIIIILIALFYPIVYIQEKRKVYYIKEKTEGKNENT